MTTDGLIGGVAMGDRFVAELTRDVGRLAEAAYRFPRTRIYDVRLTPLPDGVQIDFRTRLAPRVDIAVYKVITRNFAEDSRKPEAFAALRLAFPKQRNRFSERLEAGGFFRFDNNTQYWIELACQDVDTRGNRYGILRQRRMFRTTIRRLNSQITAIGIEGDSDSMGRGELKFRLRKFDMVGETVARDQSTEERSIGSGHGWSYPFNQDHYEYDWKGAPRRVGFMLDGIDNDSGDIPYPGQGIFFEPWIAYTETLPDWVRKSASNPDYDWAAVTFRTDLRSEPGEDSWVEDLKTASNGKLRYSARLALTCAVDAVPQPAAPTNSILDPIDVPSSQSLAGDWSWLETDTRAFHHARFAASGNQHIDIELGIDGTCHITRSNGQGPLAGMRDASVRLARLLPVAKGGRETSASLFAVAANGEVLRGNIDIDSLTLKWTPLRLAVGEGPVTPLTSGAHGAWLLPMDGDRYCLLDADGEIHPLTTGAQKSLHAFWGYFDGKQWLVWGASRQDPDWHALGDGTRKRFGDTLPAQLGAPFDILIDKKSVPAFYGVDASRMLQLWQPGSDGVTTLGSFDAIVGPALEGEKRREVSAQST